MLHIDNETRLAIEAEQQKQDKINDEALPGPLGRSDVYNKGGLKIVHEISIGKNGGWKDTYFKSND